MSLKSIYRHVRPSIVSISKKIAMSNSEFKYIPIGSGVYIDNSGIILTAFHVVKKMKDLLEPDCFIVFTFQNKSSIIAAEIRPSEMYANPEKDYALLKFNNNEISGKLDEKIFFPIKLPKVYSVVCGEEIGTLGFPLRTTDFSIAVPDLYKGIVSRVDYRTEVISNIMLDINARPGNSGGPVFKVENGELIGIIKESHKQTENIIKYDDKDCMTGIDELTITTSMVNCIPWSEVLFDLEYVKNVLGWKNK